MRSRPQRHWRCEVEAAVIGAGVIGLAVARALAIAGHSVVILEREKRFGAGISSRNSEVIHAGLYYAPGSLKERLCIAGRRRLYEYCIAHAIPHRRCGKLVFAASEREAEILENVHAHAAAAGVENLGWLDGRQAARLESALAPCAAALHSPATGILDSHLLMLSLLGEAEDHGAMLARGAAVSRIERVAGGWRIHAGGTRLECALLVNCAGLAAQAVAGTIDALEEAAIPPL